MSGYKRISLEIKSEVMEKVKSGMTVVEAARLYALSTKTIYYWLRAEASGNLSQLEMARLKKENEYLVALVGRLTVDSTKLKKKLEH